MLSCGDILGEKNRMIAFGAQDCVGVLYPRQKTTQESLGELIRNWIDCRIDNCIGIDGIFSTYISSVHSSSFSPKTSA